VITVFTQYYFDKEDYFVDSLTETTMGLGEWLQIAQKGDETALNGVCQAIWPVVDAYVRKQMRGVDEDIIEEVIQETMISFAQAIPTFQGDCSPSTYVIGIARRRMSDYFRCHKRQPEMLSFEEIPDTFFCLLSSPDQEAEANEIRELLKQLIANNLDLKQRAIIELFYHQGLTQQEISNQLSISKSTVSRQLHQALLIMRQKLHAKGITSIR
jgi:RNA polymerase sigma-70 factor (ECF subfamily)